MTLQALQNANPHIKIHDIASDAFHLYGKVLNGFDFSPCLTVLKRRQVPARGNCYVACDKEMANTRTARELSSRFYGNMEIQVGYCNGNNDRLNALEYHKCSEIDVAATDLVLLLSDIRKIRRNTLDISTVEAFFVPAQTAVELYGTTLHFAPCKVAKSGYKSIIVLTKGTNAPLSSLPAPVTGEDALLWMQNKWLIAHPESAPASNGAYPGIRGCNLPIYY